MISASDIKGMELKVDYTNSKLHKYDDKISHEICHHVHEKHHDKHDNHQLEHVNDRHHDKHENKYHHSHEKYYKHSDHHQVHDRPHVKQDNHHHVHDRSHLKHENEDILYHRNQDKYFHKHRLDNYHHKKLHKHKESCDHDENFYVHKHHTEPHHHGDGVLHSHEESHEAIHILAGGISIGCGLVAGFAVAPLVTIVDKAIVSNASGLEPLVPCLYRETVSLFTNPLRFLRQPAFRWMWFVFAGTYCTANSVGLLCDINDAKAFYPTAGFTGLANVCLNLLKDNAFAKMFSKGAIKPVPYPSLGLFAVRDCMTMYGSFALPSTFSEKMQQLGVPQSTSNNIAQLLAPMSVQLLNAPLNLLGLDLHNHDSKSTSERLKFIQKEYVATAITRCMRTLPAFGIGGLLNSYLIKEGRQLLTSVHVGLYSTPTVHPGLFDVNKSFSISEMIHDMSTLLITLG